MTSDLPVETTDYAPQTTNGAVGGTLDSRTDIPATWDERATLNAFLDYVRATVHAKCAGISDDDAKRAFLPTSPLMTIGGLVSHLRWVEASFIEGDVFGGDDPGPWTREEPDREMSLGAQIPIGVLLADYQAQCDRYNALLAPLGLDTLAKKNLSTGVPATLRWILLHLIEETARHNGHIDLLREMADGVRGG
jgi:uncharacterized damage-inducible protein DinB